LDLAVSSDGRTVFAGGIDGKVAVHQLSTNPQGRKSWSKTSHRRIHSGEVKAMATFDSKRMSVVVSGGADVAPVVTPMREYGKENTRSLPSLPQSPPVLSASKARLLVSWWDTSIYIWKIARLPSVDLPEDAHRPRKLVAQISLDTDTNVRNVSITADGRLLAASTDREVKVFQLRKRYGYDPLVIRKVHLPDDLANIGSRLMNFSPNGKWLAVVSPENEVLVAHITEEPSRPKCLQILPKMAELDRRYQQARSRSAFSDYDRTINQLAFANDSTVLVASDLSGYLDSWVLEGQEDLSTATISTIKPPNGIAAGSEADSDSSEDEDDIVVFFGQHWNENPAGHLLPKLKSAPLVLTFRPSRPLAENGVDDDAAGQSKRREEHRLWVLTAKHQMLEFDILGGRLSDWSRRNPTAALPEDFTKILGRLMGAVWDVSEERERIWLYGDSFVCMLNVGIDLADGATPLPGKKRRKSKALGEVDDDASKRRKLDSGAGGRKAGSHRKGAANVVNQYEDGAWTEVELDRQDESTEDDDEEGDEANFQLRRVEGSGDNATAAAGNELDSTQRRKFWCTFKYRPILGMVALEDEMVLDDEKPVEVVIVERPHWDVQKESRNR
jgi:U3 small nucleolar RNA-associated protein 4